MEKDGLDIQFDHDENGQRIGKYVNGELAERYAWHDRDVVGSVGYRDYNPLTARFTAKDPIGYAGGDSDLYGNKSPLGYTISFMKPL